MCNCGSNKQRVQYEVKPANGPAKRYNTVAEAQKECKGCPIKAVPAR